MELDIYTDYRKLSTYDMPCRYFVTATLKLYQRIQLQRMISFATPIYSTRQLSNLQVQALNSEKRVFEPQIRKSYCRERRLIDGLYLKSQMSLRISTSLG